VSSQPASQTKSNWRFLGIAATIVVALLAALLAWRLWANRSHRANFEARQTPVATQNVSQAGIAGGETPETETPPAATAVAAAPTTITSTASATETLAGAAGVTESETISAGVTTTTSQTGESTTLGTEQKVTEPAAEGTAAFVSPPSEAKEGDSWVNHVDGATYRFVPAGAFTMGSDEGLPDQRPAHRVTLSSFWIMQTEVTNAQYAHCVDAGACTAPANDRWNNSDFAAHPVTGVTWQQANEYALWVGGRLPTEAEWEKAARGTDGRIYPWGNEITGNEQLNYNSSMGVGDTMPVGSYPQGASPYGVLDMAGNVEEWVGDWYGPVYYARSPEENPTGPNDGSAKVLRGGSYFSNRLHVRSTAREKAFPNSNFPSSGFRVVIASEP
jgi:formylglycine-generating enzyme required for sulfatase activity